jgi:hypothetical protein
MARREVGAWLPICAVMAGLTVYGSGIAISVLEAHRRFSISVIVVAMICVFVGPLLPLVVCAGFNPWRRYCPAAGSFAVVLFLFAGWGRRPQWLECVCIVFAGGIAWIGYREFRKARKAEAAATETGEPH